MHITAMLDTLIESQHTNFNPDTFFILFTEYERKYIYDTMWNIIIVTINI